MKKAQRVVSGEDRNNTGTIEIKYIADKKLEEKLKEIKKCVPGKVHVRTSGLSGSPGRVVPNELLWSFGKMPPAKPAFALP